MASCILSFSDGDISFQRQLVIYGQVKIAPPVAIRDINSYDTDKNTKFGYVGRIDFHAKDCERLLGIAQAMKKAGLPPLHIYTTHDENSPDYAKFIELAINHSILDHFEICLNCEDKQRMYSDMRLLILPSKKEAFGNVVLEAFSFGVPVLAASYAPGPVEMMGNSKAGFLLDDMSGETVVAAIQSTGERRYRRMSAAAFERHKYFSIESHIESLERIANDVVQKFDGVNRLPVLPRLRPVDTLLDKLEAANIRV
nr:glycosyltransferase family 4 protein [Pseudogemmobacter hezensis]